MRCAPKIQEESTDRFGYGLLIASPIEDRVKSNKSRYVINLNGPFPVIYNSIPYKNKLRERVLMEYIECLEKFIDPIFI